MALSDPLMLYCERLGPDFWAEPLNAISNAGFLLAAGAAYALWRAKGFRDAATLLLIVVVALTGIGSFIFHTVATRGAALADVIPIALFIYGYFFLALRRFLGLGQRAAIGVTIAFALASLLIGDSPSLNGSAPYLPALGALLFIGTILALGPSLLPHKAAPAERTGRLLLLAAALFFVSLTARTLDRAFCSDLPTGTHFLWHLLNAVVLYLLVRAAILDHARQTGRTAAAM